MNIDPYNKAVIKNGALEAPKVKGGNKKVRAKSTDGLRSKSRHITHDKHVSERGIKKSAATASSIKPKQPTALFTQKMLNAPFRARNRRRALMHIGFDVKDLSRLQCNAGSLVLNHRSDQHGIFIKEDSFMESNLGKLSHEYIVSAHGFLLHNSETNEFVLVDEYDQLIHFFKQGFHPHLVITEYLQGYQELADVAVRPEKQEGQLDLKDFNILIKKMCSAIKHLNERGVRHGDLGSYNVMVNPETLDVKIIDFGGSSLEGTSRGFCVKETNALCGYGEAEQIGSIASIVLSKASGGKLSGFRVDSADTNNELILSLKSSLIDSMDVDENNPHLNELLYILNVLANFSSIPNSAEILYEYAS